MNILKKLIWKVLAQPGELRFHRHENDRTRDDFMERSAQEFIAWGFRPDEYAGRAVLDVGCGSKLRTLFFKDAKLFALDPLAGKFMREVPWCDLSKAAGVYSRPAEERVDALTGRMDLIICMNVLDHCFDTDTIMSNMHRYLVEGGTLLLSVDVDHGLHHLHPNLVNREYLIGWFERMGYAYTILDASASPYGMGKKFTVRAVKSGGK